MSLRPYPRIEAEHFDSLAAGLGDAAAVRQLAEAQASVHVARLELIRRTAAERFARPARLAGLAQALELIHAAERHDHAAARAAMALPGIGAWAARCAVLMHEPAASATEVGDALAYLSAIAATVAIAARVDFSATVFARHGLVHLPGMGTARLTDVDTTATISAGAAEVSISAGGHGVRLRHLDDGDLGVADRGDAGGWLPIRRLDITVDDLRLRVGVDDLDPYRTSDGLRAASRLTDDAMDSLRRHLRGAWTTLVTHHRPYAEGIATALVCLVPLGGYPKNRGVSAAFRHAFGSIAMTAPVDSTALAQTLLHETQHIKLNRVLDLIDLHTAGPDRCFRAPWRDDPRPLEGLMHGAYAFAGVTDFWRVQRGVLVGDRRRAAEFDFARWRHAVSQVLDTIVGQPALTTAGRRFFGQLRARVAHWDGVEVLPELAELADQALIDDEACWRLRNHQVDPAVVSHLSHQQASGEPAVDVPALFEIRLGAGRREDHSRQDLVGLRLREPARFHRLVTDQHVLSMEVADATAADLAYAQGDPGAVALYLAQIRADPDRVELWAGLAMALRRCGSTDLLRRLEVAYALHREARAAGRWPDPTALANWLAGGGVRSGATAGQVGGGSMSNSTR